MKDQPWVRFLDFLRQKLNAQDARIEIGGRAPDDPRLVWIPIEENRRVVVVLEAPADDRAGVERRLAALVAGFRETLGEASDLPPPRTSNQLSYELDDALAALGSRTGAETVWIIDISSPVLWASSENLPAGLDLEALFRLAEADRLVEGASLSWTDLLSEGAIKAQEILLAAGLGGAALRRVERELPPLRSLAEHGGLTAAARRLRSARALVTIRQRVSHERERTRTELRGPQIQCFAHAIAGQYQLVLVFDETYSPLHAEGHVQRALPHIERLLLSLPPIDPGGARRAKVIQLPRKG